MQVLFAVGLATGGCVGAAIESGKALEWLSGPALVVLGLLVFIHRSAHDGARLRTCELHSISRTQIGIRA